MKHVHLVFVLGSVYEFIQNSEPFEIFFKQIYKIRENRH